MTRVPSGADVPDDVCSVCYQPECDWSLGGSRPGAGAVPTVLEPGRREYRGYGEWAVHPDEAIMVLHRGYAIVDGERQPVWFVHNEAHVTQIRVAGTHAADRRDLDVFVDAALTGERKLADVAA